MNAVGTSKTFCGVSHPAPLRRETTMSSVKLLDVGRRSHTATAPCGWRTSDCRMRMSKDGFGGFSPSSSSTWSVGPHPALERTLTRIVSLSSRKFASATAFPEPSNSTIRLFSVSE